MDQTKFRLTLGHFATGITVVTTIDDKEQPVGLTANSFSSLSLDPPLILVCIDKKSASLQAFQKDAPFIVNILTEDQEDECWSFAKTGKDKFEGISYQKTAEGVPYLTENLATIHCTVYKNFTAGDHVIVTGNVNEVQYNEQANPLLFFRGKCTTFS